MLTIRRVMVFAACCAVRPRLAGQPACLACPPAAPAAAAAAAPRLSAARGIGFCRERFGFPSSPLLSLPPGCEVERFPAIVLLALGTAGASVRERLARVSREEAAY